MKSVLTNEPDKHGKGKLEDSSNHKTATPKTFGEVVKKFVLAVRNNLGENEVRALSADKVASPVLQVSPLHALSNMPVTFGIVSLTNP